MKNVNLNSFKKKEFENIEKKKIVTGVLEKN